jgi:hypothetical protein
MPDWNGAASKRRWHPRRQLCAVEIGGGLIPLCAKVPRAHGGPPSAFVQEQQRYLIATYGIVNWVRNLRAAGGVATLTQGRHSERIHAVEFSPEAAAPIFREALRAGSPPDVPAVIFRVYRSLMVLPFQGVTAYASLGECERDVLVHPVFLVLPVFVARLPAIIA